MNRERHPPRARRPSGIPVLALVLAVASAVPARAEEVGFALLLEDGVKFVQGADSSGLAAFRSSGAVRLIVNGQKGDVVGTADVFAWSRSVPDPFFAPFGPLAALGVLRLFGLEVHLGLVETPAGLETTIGVRDPATNSVLPWRGTWVFGPGTLVGGDADDLVVGGALVIGTPLTLNKTSFTINQYFPTVPFPSDPAPSATHSLFFFDAGSFYGQTLVSAFRPVRAYTLRRQGDPADRPAHPLVIHAGGTDYLVVGCSQLVPDTPTACTLSGTGGSIASGLVGRVNYALGFPDPFSTFLLLEPSLALP
jgi:hypothetical protein